MRASQQKRSRWLYASVVILILIFVGFSILPVLNTVVRDNVSSTKTRSTVSENRQEELETEARGYELVLEREPNNTAALRGIIDIKLQQNDIQGTIKPLETLANLKPEQTDYKVLLAQAKQQVRDYDGSAQAYNQVLELRPGNINALQGLVGLMLQQDRPEGAVGLLQEELKKANQANAVEPDTIDATSIELLLGQVYAQQQRYTEAVAVYDQAIDSDKQDFRPVLAKALVLQQQGKYAESKPLFITAVSLAPPKYKDQIKQMALELPIPDVVPPQASSDNEATEENAAEATEEE